jgi:hypothetical protein
MAWLIIISIAKLLELFFASQTGSFGFLSSPFFIASKQTHHWVGSLKMSHFDFIGPIELFKVIGNT